MLKFSRFVRDPRKFKFETLQDTMFDLPSRDDVVEVRVTEAAVITGGPPLLEIAPKRQKKEA